MDIDVLIKQMSLLVSEKSTIQSPMPGMLLAEIHLLPDDKENVCHLLNELVQELDSAGYQSILTVIDDDNNQYARLISERIKTNPINTDLIH